MAFDMQDDFDSDAKEIEQFGIWVKKAPEDVIETPSSDNSQNDSIFPEADNTLNSIDELDSTSFISDLPDPDTIDFSDTPAESDTSENIEPAAEDQSIEAFDSTEQSFDNFDDLASEPAIETDTFIEETDTSDKNEQTSFTAPVSHENPAAFQDFQEEDSAENWEPLDDAPDFNYPSVDNISEPPLEEPTNLEIEPSLMDSENNAEAKNEESSDFIDLTDDSSFDEIEKTESDIPFENIEDISTETAGNEKIELTEDNFDLPDFGSTPETENFGIADSQDENTEPSFDLPDAEQNENSGIDADSFENAKDDISLSEEISAADTEEPNVEVEDDFDSMFTSSETAESSAADDSAQSEADILPEFDTETVEQFDAPSIESMTDNTSSAAPENNEAPQTEEGEVELSLDDFMSSDGEVDVSSEFGLSSGDSSDVTDDFLSDLNAEFGASSEEKSDLLNEDPVDIDLEFDDQFVSDVQTDASDRIEDESNFDEMFGDSSDSDTPVEEDNFDDMFAAIQDESKPASQNSSASTAEFDEVTEFDDFLSSDSGPNTEAEKKNERRPTQQVDYNITVSQEDANTTKAPTVENTDDFEASESIPLYGTETNGNSNVAFISNSEDENTPRKAALEKSENDDFYENLFADAENIGDTSNEVSSSKEGMPPFKDSSSADEELSPTTQTEEQTMKDNFDIDINDEDVQPNAETEALIEEPNDAFDIPIIEDMPSDTAAENSSDENDNIISEDIPPLSEDNASLSADNSDTAETDSFDMPAIEDESFDTSLEIDDSLDEPTLPDLDDIEETAEDEPVSNEHIEIPSLSEDDENFADVSALADNLAEEDNLDIQDSENNETFDTSLEIDDSLDEPELPDLDNIEETAEDEPVSDEHIEISSLSEDDEDFADAAALADKLAEDDNLDIQTSESGENFDTSLEIDDSLDEPELPDLDNIEETAEDEPVSDEHIEIPSLSEDDENFVDAAALADKLAEEDNLDIKDSESNEAFDTSLEIDDSLDEPELPDLDNTEETAENEPASDEHIEISSLSEDDEDYVDAAALADKIAEEDNLDIQDSESGNFETADINENLSEAAFETTEEQTPAFDDITASNDISDNNLPSFDDITTDIEEKTDISEEEINADIADSDSSDEKCEISDSSLYNSIISNAFADAPEADENKTDNNLLDIADKSEYTENKEDEHNMDFDETLQDSGMTNQSAKGVPEQTSNISEAVLKEISNELSMLRSEISQLKQELSNVRHGTFSSQNDDVADEQTSIDVDNEPVLEEEPELVEEPSTTSSESTGFFDGDVENETIALSGDELTNILNTADFTEEYVDNTAEGDSQSGIIDDVTTAPTMDFEGENLEEPGDLEVDVQALSDMPEEEINVPKVDDLVVDSEDNFVESTEPETEESISNDTLKYLEEEPNPEEIYDNPTEETADAGSEVVPEMVDADSQDAPVEETEEITLSNEEETGPFSEVDETPTDAVFEGDQWKEESADEAAAADDIESVRKKAEQFAETDQKDLKDEIKAVLIYMDQLLENLPDEKIEEFAQSSYFETYKKLFKELGIS